MLYDQYSYCVIEDNRHQMKEWSHDRNVRNSGWWGNVLVFLLVGFFRLTMFCNFNIIEEVKWWWYYCHDPNPQVWAGHSIHIYFIPELVCSIALNEVFVWCLKRIDDILILQEVVRRWRMTLTRYGHIIMRDAATKRRWYTCKETKIYTYDVSYSAQDKQTLHKRETQNILTDLYSLSLHPSVQTNPFY